MTRGTVSEVDYVLSRGIDIVPMEVKSDILLVDEQAHTLLALVGDDFLGAQSLVTSPDMSCIFPAHFIIIKINCMFEIKPQEVCEKAGKGFMKNEMSMEFDAIILPDIQSVYREAEMIVKVKTYSNISRSLQQYKGQ